MSASIDLAYYESKRKRIYLHYRPDASSTEWLLGQQTRVLELNPQARRIPGEKLHLTVAHIGIYQDLFTELSKENAGLEDATYRGELSNLLYRVRELMPDDIIVTATRFMKFGAHSAVAALKIRNNDELSDIQKRVKQQALAFLEACSVKDPESFLAASPNLRHSATFRPHVSIVRDAKRMPPLQGAKELLMHNPAATG